MPAPANVVGITGQLLHDGLYASTQMVCRITHKLWATDY